LTSKVFIPRLGIFEILTLKIITMKRMICFAVAALTIGSCTQEPKDYVSFSGQILNQNSDSLIIRSNTDRDFKKRIAVNEDGSFSDTLKIVNGAYYVFDGSESTRLYLKNGDDIELTIDTKEFDETVVYKGSGADVNNYLAQKALTQEMVFEDKESFLLSKKGWTLPSLLVRKRILQDLKIIC
jgi:hypothetical protein